MDRKTDPRAGEAAHAGGNNSTKYHPTERPGYLQVQDGHPYKDRLIDDPDFFWHWHRSTWSARDRLRRERGSRRRAENER